MQDTHTFEIAEILNLFEQISSNSGFSYLQSMTQELGTLLDADTTFVALALDEPATKVRGVAAWKDGTVREPWEFSLSGNPCQLVYNGKPTFIPCDVRKAFAAKHESGYEGFVGTPLFDPDGAIIGHIAVYSKLPFPEASNALEIVRLCGFRAEAEVRNIIAKNEQRAAEQLANAKSELQAVFDNTPVCLNLKDTEGRYLLLNKPYEDWLGFTAEQIVGKKASEFLGGTSEVDNLSAAEQRVLDTGETFESEITVERPKGVIHNRILIKFPVKSRCGDIIGLGTAALDITDRKRAEKELEAAKIEADRASRSKSEFLAAMSHEIRTPMTGVIGFADMLLEKDLDQDSREKVGKIQNLASALLTIINDILDLSKLDAGKLEIETVNFDPSKIANDVTLLFHQTCPPSKKENLRITSAIAPGFPAGVAADPSRLRQVLVNLVGNAVKFTDQGSVSLHCETLPDADVMKFRVQDTGIGIDAETQNKLFDDFVQADASISRTYQGTGLGLAICKRLVELMGGEIGVESAPGEGSTFWFTLPFERLPEGVEIVDRQDLSKREFEGSRQLSVLVAEDNEINQVIIKAILEKMGHQVRFANNGAEAVEIVKANDFDLILMDIRMPELSGPDATRQIRLLPGLKSMVPIVALTADVMAENRQSYFDAGMNDCVAKPINQEELALAINKAVGEMVNMIKV